jgi:hypothetical protein
MFTKGDIIDFRLYDKESDDDYLYTGLITDIVQKYLNGNSINIFSVEVNEKKQYYILSNDIAGHHIDSFT